MSCIILDLDNCIADDEWRIPHILWAHEEPMRRYHKYHSLAAFDKLGEPWSHPAGSRVVIFTARPELYRHQTEEWLFRSGLRPAAVLMRSNKDNSKSVEIKERMLHQLQHKVGISIAEISHALDDREDVVAMYRSYDIRADVKFIHKTCAVTNPRAK